VKSLKTGERVSYELTQEKMAGVWARNVCATD
jgi:cold shock CspA family protein